MKKVNPFDAVRSYQKIAGSETNKFEAILLVKKLVEVAEDCMYLAKPATYAMMLCAIDDLKNEYGLTDADVPDIEEIAELTIFSENFVSI